MMQAPTALVAASLVLALACSATPSPNTSSDAAGSASGGNAGATALGGGSAGQAGNSAQMAGGGAGGNAGSAASGGSAQAGSGGTGAGTAGSAGSAQGGSGGLPPIQECMSTPSVDRFTQWTASGEGTTVPATGSILVKDGSDYVAKVQFVGSDNWHVIPVLLANKFGDAVDLSQAASFTLTYSATSALHVQLRSKSHWSGGDQYATDIPSTNGMVETRTFSFAEANWKSLFGAPALSYADTLKEAMGLVFVGNTENTVVFSGLRIDGYTPPCQ